VFEHLGKLRPEKGKYSRRGNSKRAFWMKGRIFNYAKYKAWNEGIITSRILCRQILSPQQTYPDHSVVAPGGYNAALDLSYTALRAESEGERYTGVLSRLTLAFALRV
jgi:hypothetical protein